MLANALVWMSEVGYDIKKMIQVFWPLIVGLALVNLVLDVLLDFYRDR